MSQNKIMSLLGLATKAGMLQSGEFSTEKCIKSSRAVLVVVADDSSDNTKRMFTNMCQYYDVPLYLYSNKEELGHACGKAMRACVAVTDAGFGKQLEKLLSHEQ